MLVEGLIVGSVISTFYKIDKSTKMDSEALQQYAEAYEIKAIAKKQLEKKSMEADLRLNNVVKKKRNVLEHSFPRFAKLYDVIQKVVINSEMKEVPGTFEKVELPNFKRSINAKALSDKELICTWFFHGIV